MSRRKANSSRRTVIIPKIVKISLFGGSLRAGACIMSYLAYPRDEASRRKAECALGYEAVRLAAHRNSQGPEIPVPRAYLAFSDDPKRNKILDEVFKRLSERATAGHFTRLLIRNLLLQQGGAIASSTIAAALNEYFDNKAATKADVKNFQTRILRPSYPVLHLAIVLEGSLALLYQRQAGYVPVLEDVSLQLISSKGRVGGLNPLATVYDFLLDQESVAALLMGAQAAAGLIAQTPALAGAARRLIRFEKTPPRVATVSARRRARRLSAFRGWAVQADREAPTRTGAAGESVQVKDAEYSKIRPIPEHDLGAVFCNSQGHENARSQAPTSAADGRQNMAAPGRGRLSAFKARFKKDP